jgi:hypothetical protein
MTKPKVKWSSWRKKHCPDISQETSSVYMRLASAHAEDESIFAECKSIRDAIKKLPRRRRNASADNSGSGSGANSSALLNPQPASPDLAAMLQDKAVDEIGIALRDADKLDEFETAVILRMTPHKVCVALTKAWTADQLRDLIKRVN